MTEVDEIVHADPQARRTVIVISITAFILAAALGQLIDRYFGAMQNRVLLSPSPEHAAAELYRQLKFLFWGIYVLIFSAVLFPFRQGMAILKAGRFPVPGIKVLRDTSIVRGKRARLKAYGFFGLAAALAAILVFAGYTALQLFESFDASLSAVPDRPIERGVADAQLFYNADG